MYPQTQEITALSMKSFKQNILPTVITKIISGHRPLDRVLKTSQVSGYQLV